MQKDLKRCDEEIKKISDYNQPYAWLNAIGEADWAAEKYFILEDAKVQLTSAKVICDSIYNGNRLTTMEVIMHRFALAEFNTHRAFSRNSASSRAIPVEKFIKRAIETPATPRSWGKNQKGMQAEVELSQEEQELALEVWLSARDAAVYHAERLRQIGVHKQITNRLLEPFMWHTAIVSFTDWDNFEAQRCSKLALPEFEALANAMRDAYSASAPTPVDSSYWHTPYLQQEDLTAIAAIYQNRPINCLEACKKVSVARCARVSYLTHDGKRDIKEDIAMYDRLLTAKPPHMSPFEHVAMPAPGSDYFEPGKHPGNFTGWIQLRHIVFGR